MIYLIIGLAGIIGSLLRYFTGFWGSTFLHSEFPNSTFPLGTLICNFVGCFILGWFYHLASGHRSIPSWVREGFGVGLIGSFTTFSAFSAETMNLLKNHQWIITLLYVLLSFWGGLLLVWLGYRLALVQLSGSVQRKEGK